MKKNFYKKIFETAKNLRDNYIDDIRINKSDFTRKRKVDLDDLFLQMISNSGKSQKSEIHNFYKEVNKNMDISQTAFYNARMKFNPEALLSIMQDLITEEYSEPENLVTLNGYYVMAVDGSDFVLPYTEELLDKYGGSKNTKTEKVEKVMASISTYFDCINKVFLDVEINEFKYSEKEAAKKHLTRVQEILPPTAKYVTIFDRGYPCIKLIMQMIDSDQKFLIRLQSISFKKEQSYLTSEDDDQWININYDTNRTCQFRGDKKFRARLMNSNIKLRFVQLDLINEDGKKTTSTFITNLTNEEFDTEGIYELYHLRWDVETSYRSLKSQMNVEQFSGYREPLVRQDIYASAFVYTTLSITIAENKEVQNNPEYRYKYEMKTNRNFALGILKDDLLELFVLRKHKKAVKAAEKRFKQNIVKYSCPVRKVRKKTYKRSKTVRNKSKISYKRSY